MAEVKRDKHERRAARAIKGLTAFGTSSHKNKGDGKIRSFSTANQFEGIYRRVSHWLEKERIDTPLNKITQAQAMRYLMGRASDIQQKQWANERNALQIHLRNIHSDKSIELTRYTSEREEPKNAPRAYSREQIKQVIASCKDPKMKVAIAATYQGGLRAKELFTLCPESERPVDHRVDEWRSDRFSGGREHWVSYTVIGKGKLPREVRLSPEVHHLVSQLRLTESIGVKDRGIGYEQRYDLPGGQAFSQAFKGICDQAIGWSNGPHGLRHSFAQERLVELMADGRTEEEALPILAQETGHWAEANLRYYLR